MLESTEASPLHSPADSLVRSTTKHNPRPSAPLPLDAVAVKDSTHYTPNKNIPLRLPHRSQRQPHRPRRFLSYTRRTVVPRILRRAEATPPIHPSSTHPNPRTDYPLHKPHRVLLLLHPSRALTGAALLDFDRGYATPRPIPPPSPAPQSGTAPALASLERRSRFCAKRVFCATCRAPGSNFPACARCGAAWCSRACRLPNGARHVCPSAASGADAPAPLSRTGISSPPVPISPAAARISIPSPR
ncbi:hypothetical protein C8R46DRAFT_1214290 [Mycena filopes]|nr:hypothetical protein C8R46DRAFT_1214290 [Mycena filopes]